MAFSPNAFKGAMGGPMGAPPAPGGAPKPGLDIEGLMGEPGGAGGEDMAGDIEAPGGEGAETPLQQALEQAGFQVSPDQLNQIKSILGEAGGAMPALAGEEMGEEEGGLPPMGGAPAGAPKFNSKLGKMFGK